MTAEWTEIAGKGLPLLEIMGTMSALATEAADRGVGPVQNTHLLGMVSSMF
jgi:hypothetical protein